MSALLSSRLTLLEDLAKPITGMDSSCPDSRASSCIWTQRSHHSILAKVTVLLQSTLLFHSPSADQPAFPTGCIRCQSKGKQGCCSVCYLYDGTEQLGRSSQQRGAELKKQLLKQFTDFLVKVMIVVSLSPGQQQVRVCREGRRRLPVENSFHQRFNFLL